MGVTAQTTIAAQSMPVRGSANPPVLQGKIELMIGGEDEQRPGYEFTYISGLAFDKQGRVYVCDRAENNIKVFSSTGTHDFTIGRKGAGPGEFYSAQNIALSSDGSLWVEDSGNRRISMLSPIPPAGKFLRSIPNSSNRGSSDRIHWNESGNVVSTSIASSSKAGQPFRIVRNFLNAEGATIRSDTAPAVSPDSSDSWVISVNGGIASYTKPFARQRISAFGGPGLAAFATNIRYAVRIVDGFGKQTALIERQLPLVKLKPADFAAFDVARERVATTTRQSAASLGGKAPQSKPAIANMWFDVDGRLWVEQSVATGEAHKADLYSSDGRWVSTMAWPDNVTLSNGAISGAVGLGIARNSEGLQSVVRIAWR
ncbi:MAG: 6-bladed beta-propeller, partial [Gemmatimonadaceae bacterium]